MERRDQSLQQMNQAINEIRSKIPQSVPLFVDYQTSLLLSHYLCPQKPMAFDSSITNLQAFDCAGYHVISADPHTWRFDAQTFLSKWSELVRTYNLKQGGRIWVIQAGWDIKLAADLQNHYPDLRGVYAESFGRNITIFELTVGQTVPGTGAKADPI
jgi:hypothetical protein